MAIKEESDTSYDDSEELRNDMEANKSEESVTSTIMPAEAMENVKLKLQIKKQPHANLSIMYIF